ncbi:2-methylfumaryl-CoA isomerase [Actinomadura logoneensis]|uniref:2-methylfumaryl-CoA isomerase n=1 Tax=Actinomadura logoneensis TaxID=2293572 RepID=A0A372JKR1_9ACTN|nr:CoA transferase [Actinomadura logoneensis]RFU40424.1 2-methylfumaryl-CoA isomerase [Actinomadura logoneensis]
MLEGLRIVEMSSFVAAPLGGMTLAQLGADVVRIDPLGGAADTARWPLAPSGTSLLWTGMNKGKRSVTVDPRSAEGREVVARLAAEAGIVLTNAVGGWPSYEELREARPDLILLQVEGKPGGAPAVDYTVNAEIGFPLVTGPVDHAAPVAHVLPAWDVACGLYAAVGLLAAERRRSRTGEGAHLRLPLYDVALATAGNLGLLAEAQLGVERERVGNHLYGGFGRDFALGDGDRVMVVALTRRHFNDLCEATGMAGTVTELARLLHADFSVDGDRYRHREALAALLAPWFAARTLAEVGRALEGRSVLWAPYRRFTDLDLAASALMDEIDQPGVGRIRAPASPLDTGAERRAVPAPRLGEHTDEIVSGLGLDPADLRAKGVVA